MKTAEGYAPRRLEPADAADVATLEARCFPDPWSAEILVAEFARPVFAAYGLYGPSGLAAYATLHLVAGELEILNIAVAPELRGQGLGGQLLGYVLQQTDKMGMNRGFLEVRVGNVPARRLYARHGFVVVGARKQYYADTGEDALVMVRHGEPYAGVQM